LSINQIYQCPIALSEFHEFVNQVTHLQCHGLIELNAGDIRTIEAPDGRLDVEMNEAKDETSCHGNIINVPFRTNADAERVATQLKRKSRLHCLLTEEAKKK